MSFLPTVVISEYRPLPDISHWADPPARFLRLLLSRVPLLL